MRFVRHTRSVVTQHTPFWIWLLPLAITSPWILGSIVLWHFRIDDGYMPPSLASMSLARR